ncbi:alpha/beta fold hydrolase [Dactylosporangium aurantiacum]|uniref:Alpha/beta fold hydrolase n=1 Tax=Dactylosporangium aurantiacum TaxID=35754 RepID=A0A9Q9ICI9_9ACTN|nr:alpha/beta hydrolase [Dactylosporangium aurantiacum]MDG6106942.1 alpha/beta hydrolase [Dactylosporangium aurantiacum]UWZ50698.1 alpha/beta fold hydrolase [Dactylosporangium aurantiacum]
MRGAVALDGGSLAYRSVGSGPWVVFIHGFTLDQRMWFPQVRRFRQACTVLTYDCRGFGRSTTPVGPYNHADDLRSLLSALGAPAVHLVGLSMGGRIALSYALRWPRAVRSLALIGTDVGGYRHRIDWDVQAGPDSLDAARRRWLHHDLFRTTRGHRTAWDRVTRMVGDYSGWHWLHDDVRRPVDTGTWDRLDEIGTPTTVIVGRDDLPDFHRIAAALERRMPLARKVVVRGAGHLVNLEAPGACNALLDAHLAAHA